MTRHFSVILIIFTILISDISYPTQASAANPDKEWLDLLRKFDIRDSLSKASSRTEFWRIARDNSASFNKAYKVAKSGRAKTIQRQMGIAIKDARENYIEEEYPYQIVTLLDSIRSYSGIGGLYPEESKLFLDPSEYPNSYALPDGSVYITYGMLVKMDFNPNLLMAVYARELSHFVLQHSFLNMYRLNRLRLRKRIFNELFSVISIGLSRYADMQFSEIGFSTSIARNALDLTRASRRDISRKTVVDKMNYGRELEFEADIIAYRFLEFAGIETDTYLEMLRRLNSDLEIFSRDESEHPLTEDRIKLISILRSEPDLRVKVRAQDDDIYGD